MPISLDQQKQQQAQSPDMGLPTGPQSQKSDKSRDSQQDDQSELAAVAALQSKINKAKKKYEADFKRMRDNMNFNAGLQWPGQKTMQDKRYRANVTNRAVQTKVAQLYAKNPTVEFERRQRRDFQIFDGKLEKLAPIVMAAQTHPMGMAALPLQAQALLADFANGMQQRNMIDAVGDTLTKFIQYFIDATDEDTGDFIDDAKQSVRQAIVTGVSYCSVSFVRDVDTVLTSGGFAANVTNRAKLAKALLEKLEKGELQDTDPGVQQLQSLFQSLAFDVQSQLEAPDINERLVFDWIPSTSIIVDPCCKSLKGFKGANWLVQEYYLDTKDVKAIFELPSDFKPNKSTDRGAGERKSEFISKPQNSGGSGKSDDKCLLWRVMDKKTKSECYIVDGYKRYVQPPEPIMPHVRGFWTIAALTFNDVVVEEGIDATVYPPSDVELMADAQREWNRTRNELKKHRKGGTPKWLVPKGVLTPNDKEALTNSDTNDVIELEGIPMGQDMSKFFMPRPVQPIEPLFYDDSPVQVDISKTTGLGDMQPQVRGKKGSTATAATLEAQIEMSVTQSNVEDLDRFLTTIVRIAGELTLLEAQPETVQRVVGNPVFPQMQQNREDFVNQILLKTKAASSGRPNQAVEIRNWQVLGPILQSLGANPQAMVRETIKRLGDNLDPEQFFPLQAPNPQAQQQPQGGDHQPSPQGEHEAGRTAPPQQGRPGPGQRQLQAPVTAQREGASMHQ